MGRLFAAVLLFCIMLMIACRTPEPAQPVFFSLLFPQLVPPNWLEETRLEGTWLGDWLAHWTAGRAVEL